MDPTWDRLVLVDQLRRAERHAIVSRLASMFAHLIGTPLNVIAGRASLIRTSPSSDAVLENARRIERQVETLASRIRTLIEYLTASTGEVRLRNASAIVDDALALSEPVAIARKVKLVVTPGELPSVVLEGTSTLVVLTNLLSLSTAVAPPGARIELRVIPEGVEAVLFEFSVPGFEPPTSRIDRLDPPENERSASGAERHEVLSVCYAVAQQHGALLEVRAGNENQIRLRCPAR